MGPHASPPLVFRHHPVSSLDFRSLSFLRLFVKQIIRIKDKEDVGAKRSNIIVEYSLPINT